MAFVSASAFQPNKRKRPADGQLDASRYQRQPLPASSLLDSPVAEPAATPTAENPEVTALRIKLCKLLPEAMALHAFVSVSQEFKIVQRLAKIYLEKKGKLESLLALQLRGEFPKSLPTLASPSLPTASIPDEVRAATDKKLENIARKAREDQFAVIIRARQDELESVAVEQSTAKKRALDNVRDQLQKAAEALKPVMREPVAGKESKDKASCSGPVGMDLSADRDKITGLPFWFAHIEEAVTALGEQWAKSLEKALLIAAAKRAAKLQQEAERKDKAEKRKQAEAKRGGEQALAAAGSFASAPAASPAPGAQSNGQSLSAPPSASAAANVQQQSRGQRQSERKGDRWFWQQQQQRSAAKPARSALKSQRPRAQPFTRSGSRSWQRQRSWRLEQAQQQQKRAVAAAERKRSWQRQRTWPWSRKGPWLTQTLTHAIPGGGFITNTGSHTLGLSASALTRTLTHTLNLSHKFIATPAPTLLPLILTKFSAFFRKLWLKEFFGLDNNDDKAPFAFRQPKPLSPAVATSVSLVPAAQRSFANMQRRLRMPSAWQPPDPPSHSLRMYAKLATHAITEAFNALPSPLPLERNIRGQAIRELRRTVRQGEVRIQLADKNGGVVAVSSAWYANEAMRQLNDSSAYQHVDASRAKSHIAELMGKLKALSQKLSANDRDFIFKSANSEQMPYFYLLLKMHKQPIVGRPIVSWFGYKLAPASAWLDSLLQPLLRLESSVIASSGQFSAALEAAPNHYRECWLVTADIASLYTRMPIKEVLAALSWFLHRHRELGNFQHERIQLVLDIAKLVLDATFFSFEGQMFKQIAGVAMGTPIGPSIANVTLLRKLDVPFLRLFSSDVSFYARFIDDLFAQARDRHTAIRIRSWLSALAPWLDFSVTLHNAAVPFLDMTVFKPPGFEVHGKLPQRSSSSQPRATCFCLSTQHTHATSSQDWWSAS